MEIVDHSSNYMPLIHARRSAPALALCGARPFNPWTNRRTFVTCPSCVAEIERRLRESARTVRATGARS